jgi:hypothetical protein
VLESDWRGERADGAAPFPFAERGRSHSVPLTHMRGALSDMTALLALIVCTGRPDGRRRLCSRCRRCHPQRGGRSSRCAMGIDNLLPALKSCMDPVHARTYAGKRVAVDAYAWSVMRTGAAGEPPKKGPSCSLSCAPFCCCSLLAAGCIAAHTPARKNSVSDSQRTSQALGRPLLVARGFWLLRFLKRC